MTAANDHEEAALIASLMQETLETPGKTAMLVTPDRGLAQLVMSALSRWGITVDDTAGQPFQIQLLDVFFYCWQNYHLRKSDTCLIESIKAPICMLWPVWGQFLRQLRQLELQACRGVLDDRSLDGIVPRLTDNPGLQTFYREHIETLIEPFLSACAAGTDLPKLSKFCRDG